MCTPRRHPHSLTAVCATGTVGDFPGSDFAGDAHHPGEETAGRAGGGHVDDPCGDSGEGERVPAPAGVFALSANDAAGDAAAPLRRPGRNRHSRGIA